MKTDLFSNKSKSMCLVFKKDYALYLLLCCSVKINTLIFSSSFHIIIKLTNKKSMKKY